MSAKKHDRPSERIEKEEQSQQDAGAHCDETIACGGPASSTDGGESEAAKRVAWVGRQLGKYQITAVIGSGGMGEVYRAHDATIERDVAIKILPAELTSNPTALQRFLAEAKAAGKLSHPNTVTVYEIGQQDANHFIVMELVSGGSLSDRLESHGALPVLEATQVVADACKGLTAAHAAGLVHRDMKPANLLRAQDGTVKVSDFGLAKRTDDTAMQITQAGQVLGTPYFMSPEQCESRPVDHRSDIYSLGATYYSLLTGADPYEDAGSTVQVMYAHCHAEVVDPCRVDPTIPQACAAIIARAMAKQPDDRYQTAEEMRADLNAVMAAMSGAAGIALPSQSGTRPGLPSAPPAETEGSGRRKTPMWLAVGALALLVIGVLLAVAVRSWGPSRPGQEGAKRTSDARSAAPVVSPSGEPIKVGVLHSMTGTMAHSESGVVDATLLAIEEVNQSGGLLGRPIEPIVRDGRSNAETFAREAERLIVEDAVCTIFGCWTSASRKTVVPILEEHDHLLVYPVQYEGIEESPNVIYTGAAPNQQIIPAVKWAYAFQNRRRFFLVGSDYVFPRTANEIIKDNLLELGAELVGEEYLPLGTSDVKAVVAKIEEAKPDVILNTINGDTNIPFFNELRTAGLTPGAVTTISFSIGEAELQHMNVSEMAGDFAAWNYFQSIDSPENREFVAAFKAKYGPQRVVTDPMEAAYFGVKLWAQAVTEAGDDDPVQIRRAMRNQRMRAPSGDVRIDPATQHTFKTPRIGRVAADGQFEIVWTAADPEEPQPYPGSRTSEQWKAFLHDLYAGWGGQWAAPAIGAGAK